MRRAVFLMAWLAPMPILADAYVEPKEPVELAEYVDEMRTRLRPLYREAPSKECNNSHNCVIEVEGQVVTISCKGACVDYSCRTDCCDTWEESVWISIERRAGKA